MNLAKILNFSRNHLLSSKIPSYKIDAVIILSHVLNLTKEQILLNSNIEISQDKIDLINSLLERRCKREPISHIIGRRDFFEDSFIVNSDVLDPRPDSETLIEAVLKQFINKEEKLRILELGVGSGCLVLTLLKKFNQSSAVAVDINPKSLLVAKLNAQKLNLESRIEFQNSNWFSNIKRESFDIIISNPPYIKTNDINLLQEEVKNFEPVLALDGGIDGLECYREIAKDIKSYLKNDGYLFLEIGCGQEIDVRKIFIEFGLEFMTQKPDLAGIIRCLIFKNSLK